LRRYMLVKYNEALAHNKQLRQTIDNLRRERLVFDQIYKKLEKAGTNSLPSHCQLNLTVVLIVFQCARAPLPDAPRCPGRSFPFRLN
jgi:hypothetical protein